MTKKNLRKFALYCLIIGLIIFVITYFMFHFVTDNGIAENFQEEAGKPFVTNLAGNLGLLFIFTSIISFMASVIFFNED